jgi:hypothetical protein
MKRRLIEFDVFKNIENNSLSSAQTELVEAEQILARALDLPTATLRCFGAEDVLYESVDGSFIHASYKVSDGNVIFENIEQLVIDEETETTKGREILSEMIDALLDSENEKAEGLLDQYLGLPKTRRCFTEGTIQRRREKRVRKGDKLVGTGEYEVVREKTHGHKEPPSMTNKRTKARKVSQKKQSAGSKAHKAARRASLSVPGQKKMNEWASLCENVLGYVDYQELGPVLSESTATHDERGNVVSLMIPSKVARNEAKMLNFNWKTLNTDVVVKRNGAKQIAESVEFAKAATDLKRHNNLSDNDAMVETLENIVQAWPDIIYLTEGELSEAIKLALESTGSTNYDDAMCNFLAEGILRTAHDTFVDRVNKVLNLAGANLKEAAADAYAHFKSVVDGFYPHLDESTELEMQVFVDLYETLRQVHQFASQENDTMLQSEVSGHLRGLLPIVQQEVEPRLEVASAAAEWLYDLIETNLETQDWKVSNKPHVTVSGDHPAMAQKARHPYNPAGDASGDWGDSAPVSDGSSYKGGLADEMRNRSWGNWSSGDTFPGLNNPYIHSPFGDYKIKGEKHIDSDSGQLGQWGDGNTWPNLQNPYNPKAETPQTWKQNLGKDDDLVVDM